MSPLERAASLGLALALDRLGGEPPAALHPVVWLGRAIAATERRLPRDAWPALATGAALAATAPVAAALAGLHVERVLQWAPAPMRVLATAVALKPAFAVRALLEAGTAVETALRGGDTASAHCGLRALVSRDVAGLDAPLVAAAAIESLAENLTDSVVAPLLAFSVAGLSGAYAYRAVNTLDSMIGYRGAYERLGKAAARLDDAVNYLPARLAALLLVLAAPATGRGARGALRTALRDHGLTSSPNAGWTMAAAAGALGVRLEKRGHYVLNPDARLPDERDLRAAGRMVAVAAVFAAITAAAISALQRRMRSNS